MLSRKFLFVFSLVLIACSSGQHNKPSIKHVQSANQEDSLFDNALNPAVIQLLKEKQITKNGNFYLMTRNSDSTFILSWGNDTLHRVYKEPLHLMVVERITVKWENKDYIILDYNTGSNAWVNVALPLNNKEKVQEFGNGLYFDSKTNYFITEEFNDTIFLVHNLKTGKTQYVTEKECHCEYGMNYACVDKFKIENKVLYYNLITPNIEETPNKRVKRKVRLKI